MDGMVADIGARQFASTPGVLGEIDSRELRTRAFSLLVRAYSQAQRAITYLRWDHGDAQELAPSIYTGARTKRRAATAEPVDAPVADAHPAGAPPLSPPSEAIPPHGNGVTRSDGPNA